MTEITWLGHSCFSIGTGSHNVIVDPFLDDSPTAPIKSDAVKADYILITHGHFDHIADAVKIAKRTGATTVSNYEISLWLGKQGVANAIGMNHGGAVNLPFGNVKFTIAHHSSVLPDGTYGGNPGGFLITLAEGPRIYIAGDTGLFGDMALYSRDLELAVLPIGDLYTMGPDDSLEAVKLLNPNRVMPCHYNTMPPIKQDAALWAKKVREQTSATPETPKPGEKITL